MSTSGYGKIERGEIDLTLSKLCKISAIFSISIKIYCILMFQIFLRMIQRGESKKAVVKEQGYLIKNAYLILRRRIFT
jgi:hypothetical protein